MTSDLLLPWPEIRSEHRWAYPLMMLRAEQRRRRGEPVSASVLARLDRWLAMLRNDSTVVAYDPATPLGFTLVLRTADDTDLVRVP